MSAVFEKTTPVWINQIEKLINKALGLDEETLVALGQLEGKVIAFEFINTKLILYIFPSAQGLDIRTEFDDGHATGLYSWGYLYELGEEQSNNWMDYLDALKQAGHVRQSHD